MPHFAALVSSRCSPPSVNGTLLLCGRNAPAAVRLPGRCRSVCPRPPRAGRVSGGRAVCRPAAVGGEVGPVRPQHREEQPRGRLLRRPEPEAPSPAAAQETHPVSEVSSASLSVCCRRLFSFLLKFCVFRRASELKILSPGEHNMKLCQCAQELHTHIFLN